MSPYKILDVWLKDGNINTPFPVEILPAISHKYILSKFVNFKRGTHLINNMLNRYDVTSLPIDIMCLFLKEMIIQFGWNSFSYIKYATLNKEIKELQGGIFEGLKPYEIKYLLTSKKFDEEYKELVDIKSTFKKRRAKFRPLPKKKVFIPTTFDHWKRMFD